jgi:hypothetical protein
MPFYFAFLRVEAQFDPTNSLMNRGWVNAECAGQIQ